MNENISIQNYQSTTTYLYTKCEVLVRDAIFSPYDRLGNPGNHGQEKPYVQAKSNSNSSKSKNSVFLSSTEKKVKVYSSNASICQLKILIKVFIVCEPNC